MWLIFGVPVCFVLGMALAHIMLVWIGTIIFDWVGAGTYSFSQALEALLTITKSFAEVIRGNHVAPPTTSYLVVAFGAGWMFVCSTASAGAIATHVVEERPGLPLWLVYMMLFITWGGICYATYANLSSTAGIMSVVEFAAIKLAILAGIVASRPSMPEIKATPMPLDAHVMASP